ncbi:MAG: hypothetical protein ABIJ47_01055 [Candidatus Bathyarchaeota archaeon]
MPKGDAVGSYIEERRQEVHRLVEGALLHLGIREYSVSVTRRRGVDVYSPEEPLFAVKAEVARPLGGDEVEFVVGGLRDRGYSVKRLRSLDDRLLLLV